jgi:RNA polymerase sigma-70 factor, ECF subfamily
MTTSGRRNLEITKLCECRNPASRSTPGAFNAEGKWGFIKLEYISDRPQAFDVTRKIGAANQAGTTARGSSTRRTRACASAYTRQTKEIDPPSTSAPPEAVRLAQKGDHKAFETIYRVHWRRVYALCLRMVRNGDEAEELSQEVFMQVFLKIQTFRGESAFSSWLHRVTTNHVLMHLRKRRVAITTSLDELGRNDDGGNRAGNELGAPDLRLTSLFDRFHLQTGINQLSEGHKRALLLHDVQGFNHSEIAEIVGCSVGNSKCQLHRARKRLRNVLCGTRVRGARKNIRVSD